jgi:L-ascorbate metabolism protein UlaG (beta-lactamase superfamily)
MLLEIGSIRLLTDPVFDQGERNYRLGPGAYATRHVGPAIDPAGLGDLDAVLLSHAHHLDNLDESGQKFVARAPLVITGRVESDRAGPAARRLSVWETTTIVGRDGFRIEVTATPAVHGPWWFPGARHVVGFVLEWPGQQKGALYLSGDTVYFRGMRRIAKRFRIGTAILHLGAVHFWPPWPSFLRFTMTGRQAARCAGLLGAQTVIPIHYERSVWSHFRESRESYQEAFRSAGLGSRVVWLPPGDRTVLDL